MVESMVSNLNITPLNFALGIITFPTIAISYIYHFPLKQEIKHC